MPHSDRMADLMPRVAEQLGSRHAAGGLLGTWYVTPGGWRLAIAGAIHGPEQTVESDEMEGRRQRRLRTLTLQVKDKTVWQDLQSPKPSGTVILQEADGEVQYAIESVQSLSDSQAVLQLVRTAHAEFTRPGYRK